MTDFHVEINGGSEQVITTKTSEYALAALASLAQLDYKKHTDYDVVKIWVPKLVPEYGPYFYAWDGHQMGFPEESRKW